MARPVATARLAPRDGGSTSSPRVGFIGAGQLARMTYQAGISLGLTVRVLAEESDESAARVAAEVTLGETSSEERLAAFCAGCDIVTFDHELVDHTLLAHLEASGVCFRPSPATKALAQNKRRQRAELGALGFPVPPFANVETTDDVLRFAERHGWPVVIKASRGGYDGRGVWMVEGPEAAERVVREAQARGTDLLVEIRVPIERELAVLVARRPGGESTVYPLVETVQRAGICREVLAPAPVSPELALAAQRLASEVAGAIDAVGILAVELFLAHGSLLINELAARPHNSGHFSIEGATTSQFENHLRAVLDWPLGDPSLVAPAVATVNVLGEGDHDPRHHRAAALAVPGAHLHLYDKTPYHGRKLGHVTVLADTLDDALRRARRAARLLATGIDEEEAP